MSKIILKFDTNDPEDREEFNRCSRASDLCFLLWDFDQHLREQIKYNENLTEEQANTYEEIREKLYDMMEEKGLNFDYLMG